MKAREYFAAAGRSEQDVVRISDIIGWEESRSAKAQAAPADGSSAAAAPDAPDAPAAPAAAKKSHKKGRR